MSSDEEEEFQRNDSARTASYISDHETQNNNSDYCKFRKRQVKELSKILAKEMIQRANKKALQILQINNEENQERPHKTGREPSTRHRGNLDELLQDIDLSWVTKSFTRQK